MGRNKLPELEKKDIYWISITKKVADKLGKATIKEVAETSINRYYKKQVKNDR